MTSRVQRRLCLIALGACALLLPSCAWDGHLDILGYSTKPNYDTRYRTVRVPIPRNRTWTTATPLPGMEMDLQRILVREIEQKTPYKVVQGDADTELTTAIVGFQKNLLNYTQFNTVREAEMMLVVEVVWRDLRTGEVLSRRARRFGQPLDADGRQPLLATTPDSVFPPHTRPVPIASAPAVPTIGAVDGGGEAEVEIIDPLTRKKAVPLVFRSVAQYRPELGESITTALQRNYDRVAVQIVSAMEVGW